MPRVTVSLIKAKYRSSQLRRRWRSRAVAADLEMTRRPLASRPVRQEQAQDPVAHGPYVQRGGMLRVERESAREVPDREPGVQRRPLAGSRIPAPDPLARDAGIAVCRARGVDDESRDGRRLETMAERPESRATIRAAIHAGAVSPDVEDAGLLRIQDQLLGETGQAPATQRVPGRSRILTREQPAAPQAVEEARLRRSERHSAAHAIRGRQRAPCFPAVVAAQQKAPSSETVRSKVGSADDHGVGTRRVEREYPDGRAAGRIAAPVRIQDLPPTAAAVDALGEEVELTVEANAIDRARIA